MDQSKILNDYDVKIGERFTMANSTEEYVCYDLITHGWNADSNSVEILPEPQVVFRSVHNVNHPNPVPYERISVALSVFRSACNYANVQVRGKEKLQNDKAPKADADSH